jgi:hypothetical protein
MNWRTSLLAFVFLNFGSACASRTSKDVEVKSSGEMPPLLLKPNVKKIWIQPLMKNNGQEWEAGNYLYRIERGTAWAR